MLPEEHSMVAAFPGHVTEESLGVSSQVAVDVDAALEVVKGTEPLLQCSAFVDRIHREPRQSCYCTFSRGYASERKWCALTNQRLEILGSRYLDSDDLAHRLLKIDLQLRLP